LDHNVYQGKVLKMSVVCYLESNCVYQLLELLTMKALLPYGVEVSRKILKYVGEKVGGCKYFLGSKYVKERTTKDLSYNLEKNIHSSTIGA